MTENGNFDLSDKNSLKSDVFKVIELWHIRYQTETQLRFI